MYLEVKAICKYLTRIRLFVAITLLTHIFSTTFYRICLATNSGVFALVAQIKLFVSVSRLLAIAGLNQAADEAFTTWPALFNISTTI